MARYRRKKISDDLGERGSHINYNVRHVLHETMPLRSFYPKSITFRTATTIASPGPGLLEIHTGACAPIAHATRAAEVCSQLFRGFDEGTVRADGSTLDHLLAYQLSLRENHPSNLQEHPLGESYGGVSDKGDNGDYGSPDVTVS
ncbi:hypothetical protein FQN54_002475 [Arachnomyces sp. PD_36]|nr:hypothetical protein FQN54_002475 [Arachnomyces sp. PD_36]